MFEPGPRARRVIIASFVGVQLLLVASADWRPDRVFGFRMFNESSSLRFDLYREVRRGQQTRLLPLPDGEWRSFRWSDRVKFGSLMRPGVMAHATYGLDAQVFRLRAALRDAARSFLDDPQTIRLVADVTTIKNGRPGPSFRLTSDAP